MDEHGGFPADINWDLYEPFERLLAIEVCGRRLRIPEKNPLLRGLQFVFPDVIPYGNFCWNGVCENCHCYVRHPGPWGEKRILACQTRAAEGIRIVRLGPELALRIGKPLQSL